MSMSDNTNPCHPGVAEVEETYRLLQDDKLRPYVCDCGRKTNNLKGCCGEIASLEREVEVLKHRVHGSAASLRSLLDERKPLLEKIADLESHLESEKAKKERIVTAWQKDIDRRCFEKADLEKHNANEMKPFASKRQNKYFQGNNLVLPVKCWKGKKGCTKMTQKEHGRCVQCNGEYRAKQK